MRRATKTVATWLGVVAGMAGLEHGYFEILLGHFFNDYLQSIMSISLLVILTSLPLAVCTAYAYDAVENQP